MNHQNHLWNTLEKQASKSFQNNDYGKRHFIAFDSLARKGLGIPAMILALAHYADEYQARFESEIGTDGVLGEYWKQILTGVRGLLNGELGALDGGCCDQLLVDLFTRAGFDESDL